MRLERCGKVYRRGAEVVAALRDVDLVLGAGELVALLGPSGSGKTTLLNLLAGWEQPDSGRVVWSGATGAAPGWSRLAVVPQRLGLLEELTVGENVALPALLAHGDAVAGRAEALLAQLGLEGLADRLPDEVSLGEQQRAAVARALVLDPPLVLLDEPTGHQDEQSAKAVLDLLQRARDGGTTCLLATHAPEVRDIADRTVTLADGRIQLQPPGT